MSTKEQSVNTHGPKGTFPKVSEAAFDGDGAYGTIIRAMMDGAWIADTQGRCLDVNEAYCDMTGYTREELLTMSIQDVEAVETHADTARHCRQIIKEGKSRFETRHRCKDGRVVDVEVVAHHEPASDGRFIMVLRDITEHKQTEDALRNALRRSEQHEKKVEALLDAARAVLEHQDFEQAARAIFEGCKRLIGATSGYVALLSADGMENEVLFLDAGGRPCSVNPSLPMPIRGLRAEAYKHGVSVYENNFANSKWAAFLPGGHVTLDNVLFAPLVLDGGIVGIMGLANKPESFDDNDARLASAFGELAAVALRNSKNLESRERSRERLNAVISTATDAIVNVDAEGNVVLWNPEAERMFGYARAEILGKSLALLMPEKYQQAHREGLARMMGMPHPQQGRSGIQLEARRKDGTIFPIELSLAVWDVGGQRFATGLIRDITERVSAEMELERHRENLEELVAERTRKLQDEIKEKESTYAALRQSEELFAQLAGALDGEVFWFMSANPERMLYVSPGFENLWGRTVEALYEDPRLWIEAIHSDDRDRVAQDFGACLRGEQSRVDFEYRIIRPDGTERWMMDVGVAHPGKDGKPDRISGIARDITGRKQAEKVLQVAEERYRTMFECSRDAVMTLAPPSWKFASANTATLEMFRAKDETHFTSLCPWDVSPKTQPDERPSAEKVREMIETAMREGSHFFEWTHKRVNGEEFPATVLLSRMEWNGEPMLQATVRDVTHEIQLESQLRQAHKMEAIGTLAGGIAHDFNNILSAMLGYSDLAMANLPEDSDAFRDLAEVVTAGHRATDLVRQILAFSRQSEEERKPARIQLIVKEALKLLRSSLPSTIEIDEDVDVDCPPVLADPTQIHQVLMNLCTNAYHAMEDSGGTLSVTLRQTEVTPECAEGNLELSPGDYICLAVSDTGHGMDEETKQRLFEPYFTTKAEGKGTGLGLAVVHGIISEHDGTINVHSEPGQGTEFRIYLPVLGEPASTESDVTQATQRGSCELILMVDDEVALLEAQKRQLERLGYRIAAFSSPEEALVCFSQDPMGFDLVITDATMPKITGTKLTEKLRTIRQDIPVILVTGLNNESARDKARRAGIQAVLSKPVSLGELGGTVQAVIAQSILTESSS